VDVYSAAVELATCYRLDALAIRTALAQIYPDGGVPQADLPFLAQQVEQQIDGYEYTTDYVDVTLALVKHRAPGTKRGWTDVNGDMITTSSVPKNKEHLITQLRAIDDIYCPPCILRTCNLRRH
jgi:hypothetical protein